MSATPESFAYRCLPLNIANAHGWEVLSPCSFDARWTGGTGTDQVDIRLVSDVAPELRPVSLFGQGVLTFHIAGLFRTPAGWNLWVGGSPNKPKEGIYPLTGIVETDWAPYTFTMNWRFTRRYRWVRFEIGEPICFFYPIQRGYLKQFTPKFVPMESDPDVMHQFHEWSRSRNEFHDRMAQNPPEARAEKWQKDYYRGVDPEGTPGTSNHETKLRVATFATTGAASPRADTQEPSEPTVPDSPPSLET